MAKQGAATKSKKEKTVLPESDGVISTRLKLPGPLHAKLTMKKMELSMKSGKITLHDLIIQILEDNTADIKLHGFSKK
jgi:hypothetical protein